MHAEAPTEEALRDLTPARPQRGNTPPPGQRGHEAACDGHAQRPAPSLSPDPVVKGLIAAMDQLQQQQAHAEAARHAAEQAAAAAAEECVALKAELHAALHAAAEVDDRQEYVSAALEAALQEQGVVEEQLRREDRALASLRAALCGADVPAGGGSSGEQFLAAEHEHEREMRGKRDIVEELRDRLLALGLDPATLAQLCAHAEDAAHSSAAGSDGAAGGGSSAGAGQRGAAGRRKAGWLGGAGSSGGGLLSGLSVRWRGSVAG